MCKNTKSIVAISCLNSTPASGRPNRRVDGGWPGLESLRNPGGTWAGKEQASDQGTRWLGWFASDAKVAT